MKVKLLTLLTCPHVVYVPQDVNKISNTNISTLKLQFINDGLKHSQGFMHHVSTESIHSACGWGFDEIRGSEVEAGVAT